jgi:3-oxoacyl-[acyl-carrier protein] reductase
VRGVPAQRAVSLLGLEAKVVLVTGAAAGIGAATAELFAEQGAVLALCDRAEGFGQGDDPFHRSFDVRDAAALTAFVDEVAARFGHIDVVVNNAGGTFGAALLDVSAKGEAALVAENFTQVTQLVRAAVPHVPPGGCIVNVTSIEAHRAAPLFAVYSAMKAAQANLTQTLALELAPRGIRVNAMAPDVLLTEGTGSAGGLAGAPEASARPYRTAAAPPLGHWGTARDGAGAILFLASDLARFVTGTTVHVDGGNLAAGGWHRVEAAPSASTPTSPSPSP